MCKLIQVTDETFNSLREHNESGDWDIFLNELINMKIECDEKNKLSELLKNGDIHKDKVKKNSNYKRISGEKRQQIIKDLENGMSVRQIRLKRHSAEKTIRNIRDSL